MFIGRTKELEELQKKYDSTNFETSVVYGRKRIGKTSLLQEFCADKEFIYYICTEQNLMPQLNGLAKEISNYFKDNSLLKQPFSLEDLLLYVSKQHTHEKLVLVIDEFQNLVANDKSVLASLEKSIYTILKNSDLLLILASSTIGFVENDFHATFPNIPMLKLNQLSFYESLEYLSDYNNEDKIKIFSITGGVPYYMDIMLPNKSFEKNIVNNLLNSYSELFDEPRYILLQELRELSQYNGILESIATRAYKG